MMATSDLAPPTWDKEQLAVIHDDPASWQLVEAGPGAGKSAVACKRIAHLIHEGVPASRILLVSFTRTAVAELRDRIITYAAAGDRARSVRISTIDSHAWSLRVGFDDEEASHVFNGSYDWNIQRVLEMLRGRNPDLLDFLSRLEHLIIDEAQDVVGLRADLVVEMLSCLPDTCGVTVLADPAQAIYGFTTDDGDHGGTPATALLDALATGVASKLTRRHLFNVHRTDEAQLIQVFERTRREVQEASTPATYVGRVQDTIRNTCHADKGAFAYKDLPDLLRSLEESSALVLFRRRADVLLASSYCSSEGIAHRLRMSGSPNVVHPWLGWLFGETEQGLLGRKAFDDLWSEREALAPNVFRYVHQEEAWALLQLLAAASRPGAIDLVQLRRLIARSRPPVEVCSPEVGDEGPILGTIHASKGREADTVVLVMPPTDADDSDQDPATVLEEGRVYYVGATRARKLLWVAGSSSKRVGHLPSGRVYRNLGRNRTQLEVGRDGDVDPLAHLAWTNAKEIQRRLAGAAGQALPVTACAVPEQDFISRLYLSEGGELTPETCIGQMSKSFQYALYELWGTLRSPKSLRPASEVRHLHLAAVTTVALSDEQLSAASAPFSRSGFAIAPAIKGFPMIPFFYRRRTQ
jgi:hypothetical protein